nr:DUF4177 domain-containing protein [Halobium salinum]
MTERQRWEYETLQPSKGPTHKELEDPKPELNELGDEGWELVDTVEYVGGGTKFLILKRPASGGDHGSAESRGSDDGDENDSDDETGEGTGSGERR